MSSKQDRALTGPVAVVAGPKTFAERFVDAGLVLPDQAKMKLMMRAARYGLSWRASERRILKAEALQPNPQGFRIYGLDDYKRVKPNTFGAPIPAVVARHIHDVKGRFPSVIVNIHALERDDPFVECVNNGESLITMAWRRNGERLLEVYPTEEKGWIDWLRSFF